MNVLKLFLLILSFQWSQTSVWSNPSLDDISETSSINNLADKQDGRKKIQVFISVHPKLLPLNL